MLLVMLLCALHFQILINKACTTPSGLPSTSAIYLPGRLMLNSGQEEGCGSGSK